MKNKKYKVEYLDWEDHEGNFGTNFVVILKAGDREEAKEELDKLLSENVDGDGRRLVLPPVLDACCGGRMMWFDREDSRALFVDRRCEVVERSVKATEKGFKPINVNPDVQADFTDLPFPDESFSLVVFDPPHGFFGATSFMAKEYGTLRQPDDWQEMLKGGFAECFRVLKANGTLIFKWNETDVTVSQVLALTDAKPLFGHKSGKQMKTHWIAFLKQN